MSDDDDEEKNDLRIKSAIKIVASLQQSGLQSGGEDLDLNLEYNAERTPTLAEDVESDDLRTSTAFPENAIRRQESVGVSRASCEQPRGLLVWCRRA
jgi:hypothetical protein